MCGTRLPCLSRQVNVGQAIRHISTHGAAKGECPSKGQIRTNYLIKCERSVPLVLQPRFLGWAGALETTRREERGVIVFSSNLAWRTRQVQTDCFVNVEN